jgi:hypothetical protein
MHASSADLTVTAGCWISSLRRRASRVTKAPENRVTQPGRSINTKFSGGLAEPLPHIILDTQGTVRRLAFTALPGGHPRSFLRMDTNART